MLRTLFSFVAKLFVLFLLLGSCVAYHAYIEKPPFAESKLFVVPRGASLSAIADKLQEEHLCKYPKLFKYSAVLLSQSSNIKAGEYEIAAHSSIKQILKILTAGKFYEHILTIPEGLTIYQIVDRLNKESALTGSIEAPLPDEGSLMPTSLKYLRGTKRNDILKRLKEAQAHQVAKIWENRDLSIPLKNSAELVNLASIVEKEAKTSAERYLIASVFYNRLAQNMRLQSDPTVVYGIYGSKGKPKETSIYKSDLENVNMYNTYKIFGLPKTPIANPGYDALYATAHPAKTKYLYFVAGGHGTHIFSETLEQHNKAVQAMRTKEQVSAAAT